ncbi:putative bifunctional diguanylate cyclase/phosphodiesterase [Pseudoduganella chitinolytica]|uniref:Sensor domain-containing phosphodiesterase n=1 Tax=Pseudoduganella chitinolytica TaxID=34070 RepID=A0ABY8BH33_9BURK|nr:sensor domain-containing phosphodiesterase [Pseudoduganella chitinolytica]WEF34673.1 sensor domain-containing phosphodiesterase [Pseudoduganella chitinolytica]
MLSGTPTVASTDTPSAFDGMLEEAGDIVFRADPRGHIRFASRRAATLAGGAELVGQSLRALVCEADHGILKAALAEAQAVHVARAELRLRHGDVETPYDLRISSHGAELLLVGRDLTAQHATEARLRHMATHDALTGLPNRALLSDRIRMTIAQARRTGQGFAVATVGLDGFKKVNDGLGHPAGDAVLCMAAARLRKMLRDSDTLARVGGDEFVAVLPGTFNEAQIRLVTGRLLATLQSPFDVDGQTVYVGASVGVSVYPQHAEDEIRLLALADAALSRAKETGKARCVVYNARHSSPTEHDISLEAAMFQAVREGEFVLYYQPIVDAATREIEGFETLMRWKHPTLGMVPPARFIPLAETNGLINLLGAWALKAACVQLRQFEAAAKRSLYMSVNISPRQFRNDKFLDVLDDALAYSGVAGEQLVLEITEGTLMIDPVHAESILGKMVERRARIAIDDFGTGYSSLAYLKNFPISVLKIDRAFIRDLPGSQKDGAICNAVLDLAKHLSLSVVAEGVETEEQIHYMRERGCRYVQGYLTGKPMAANVAVAALTERHYADLCRDQPQRATG